MRRCHSEGHDRSAAATSGTADKQKEKARGDSTSAIMRRTRQNNAAAATSGTADKQKEKALGDSTSSLIMRHVRHNHAAAVRKLLAEEPKLVYVRDCYNRTPLHDAALHGWMDVAMCLLYYGADVNAWDRWNNSPLADAKGAKKLKMIELLMKNGGLSFGQNGSRFEPKPIQPPLPSKCDWEIDPNELDFSDNMIIGKGSFAEIIKAYWRGTPVAVKRILPSRSEEKSVVQNFRREINLLAKLRHPNIVQFFGAVTEKKPLMLITEYLSGGDLHQYLESNDALSLSTAVNFAMDIARGMAYLHSEPDVIIHRDLKPGNVLLMNSSADHLKVIDFGLSISQNARKMTGKTGSYRYMAPEVFTGQKYDNKVDVFSFGMILYQMLVGERPFLANLPNEAAVLVAGGIRPNFQPTFYVKEMKELVKQCWSADAHERPSFIDILKRLEEIKGEYFPL